MSATDHIGLFGRYQAGTLHKTDHGIDHHKRTTATVFEVWERGGYGYATRLAVFTDERAARVSVEAGAAWKYGNPDCMEIRRLDIEVTESEIVIYKGSEVERIEREEDERAS